jgi:hypothetical protein
MRWEQRYYQIGLEDAAVWPLTSATRPTHALTAAAGIRKGQRRPLEPRLNASNQ